MFDSDEEDYGEGRELTPEEADELRVKMRGIHPMPYKLKSTKKRIAIVDTETDPFAPGCLVKPFAVGLDMGDRYLDWWGDDCIAQFFAYVQTLTEAGEEWIFYAHNGGKFDFFFMLDYLDKEQEPFIMGARLVKVFMAGQEFRDSYSIIPQPLSSYKKDEIDYQKFTRDRREQHKAEILQYLRTDCAYLMDLVTGFHEQFGDKLTIASAALPMLRNFHGFNVTRSDHWDERFRGYFHGGRNQCFETGILKPRSGSFKLYDRNSMYPAVMRDELHPIGTECVVTSKLTEDTDFACIEAWNDGALAVKAEDGSLSFTVKEGRFHTTGHELRAGLETGTLRIKRFLHGWRFTHRSSFAEFVHHFYAKRLEAKVDGDKVRDILYKLILNSAYGKFALNPRKFKQWLMTINDTPDGPLASEEHPDGWNMEMFTRDAFLWSRPTPRKSGFYNVATAASITGAARANLLRNLALAERPIYCDTDSIICEGFRGELNEKELGGWKLEGEGDTCAIAGKKLYCLFDGDSITKRASKGVNLTPAEIMRVCNGEEVVYANPVPTFKLSGDHEFITRKINMTGGK